MKNPPITQRKQALCIDGDRWPVVDMGEGPDTVLLLHGLFGTPDHWRVVMEKLCDRFRVIAPQLPIDPQPGRRKHGMKTISDLTEQVIDFIRELKLDSLVLGGNSLGGLIAIDCCLKEPSIAKGLVLAGSAGLFERSPIRGLRSRPSRDWVRTTVLGILYNEQLATDELIDDWHKSFNDRDYVRFLLRVSRATRDRCVEEELHRVNVPTMIVWGRNDEITPPATAEEFQRLIKTSQLEFIEECGHAPNWERPDEFSRLLSEFLPSCFQV